MPVPGQLYYLKESLGLGSDSALIKRILKGSGTVDFANIDAAGKGISANITVTGAALGDFVLGVAHSLDPTGGKAAPHMVMHGVVSAADTVTVAIVTATSFTSGGVDLASGTVTVYVADIT